MIVNRDAQGIEVINDWNGFGQRTTASGTVKLNQVEVNPELIFDERLLTQVPTYRGAYSQLLQVAIDVGIAEARLKILYRLFIKHAQLLMQMLKSQL